MLPQKKQIIHSEASVFSRDSVAALTGSTNAITTQLTREFLLSLVRPESWRMSFFSGNN